MFLKTSIYENVIQSNLKTEKPDLGTSLQTTADIVFVIFKLAIISVSK